MTKGSQWSQILANAFPNPIGAAGLVLSNTTLKFRPKALSAAGSSKCSLQMWSSVFITGNVFKIIIKMESQN